MSWTVEEQADPKALALMRQLTDDQGHFVTRNSPELAAFADMMREDYPSFCALLLRVRPKGGGFLVPFVFNEVQRYLWAQMVMLMQQGKPLWIVFLKFRQAGSSTFWCAWIFWQMWRQRDIQSMVVAHQLATAETMIETMRVFYDEMPPIFRPELRDGNHGATIPRGELYFADRRAWCLIHLAKNIDPRGQQVTHVLETEFAMYPNAEELNGALLPQLPTLGSEARLRSSFIIESTPKSQNAFYEYYWNAKHGKSDQFHAVLMRWFCFEEQYSAKPPPNFRLNREEKELQARLSRVRIEEWDGKPVTIAQMYWRRQTIINECHNSEDVFLREYVEDEDTCWMLASRSVFRQHTKYLVKSLEAAHVRATELWANYSIGGRFVNAKGPAKVTLIPKLSPRGNQFTPVTSVEFTVGKGDWLVWAPPEQGHKYVLGCDPSMGFEDGDRSVICVIDVTTGCQVAEFGGSLSPERFALECAAAGYWYNVGLVNPEVNNMGYVVLKRLIANIAYPNLYRWPKFDEVNRYTPKRGWESNTRTKQLMVSTMVATLEEELVQIASRELYSEMTTYEKEDHGDSYSFDAQRGKYDDRVVAFGLAIMAIEQSPVLAAEFNARRSMLPSAADLHLDSTRTVEIRPTPLPKTIERLISKNVKMPWNPMQGELPR